MSDQPKNEVRSLRLTPDQSRFVDAAADFELSREVRQFVEEQRARYASGICAVCGRTVYLGAHTVTTPGTPLGNALELTGDAEIDLCEHCQESAFNAVSTDDADTPPTAYMNRIGQAAYAAHRHAVMHSSRDHHNPTNGIDLDVLLTENNTNTRKTPPGDAQEVTIGESISDVIDIVRAWLNEHGPETNAPVTAEDIRIENKKNTGTDIKRNGETGR